MTDAAHDSSDSDNSDDNRSSAADEPIVDRILKLFETRGSSRYGGEDVTQTQHALQAAWLAEQAGSDSELIAAALMHDIGHLLHDLDDDFTEDGIDDLHEQIGARWLTRFFGLGVTEPIRLHVLAKRYRCAIDPTYLANLSPTSQKSLQLQGGIFTRAEAAAFREDPFAEHALRLRVWDDEAKIVGLETPGLSHFREYLVRSVSS